MSVGYEFFRQIQPTDFKPTCGHAIPPLVTHCSKPSPNLPTIASTYPGWWTGPMDYYYGMHNYTKHTLTDTMLAPFQDMIEQKEGNQIDFYLRNADQLRWNNWPGTTPFVGDIDMGEVVAPPGTESTLKISENLRWTQHAVPMNNHECQQEQAEQDIWNLTPITRSDKSIHYGIQ